MEVSVSAEPLTRAGSPEAFVWFWEEAFRAPAVDDFVDAFLPLLHPDVRLHQPIAPTAHGVRGFERQFRELFSLWPDLSVKADHWAARDEFVYIWFTMSATIGGRHKSWRAIDRFRFVDGLIIERVHVFDPLPLLPAVLLAPSSWPRLLGWSLRGALKRR
jgi:predicted SnoaL-like aldol condensation-catalyzing enzyme